MSYSHSMQWYSYSKNSDLDKLRSVGHCCDGYCGGFEYEYCFAEYEYRFAEYDANRKTLPIERLLSARTLIWFVNRLSSTCVMLLRADRWVSRSVIHHTLLIVESQQAASSVVQCSSHPHPPRPLLPPKREKGCQACKSSRVYDAQLPTPNS